MADIENVLNTVDLGDEPPVELEASEETEVKEVESQETADETEETEGEEGPAGESPEKSKPQTKADTVPLAALMEAKHQLRAARLKLAQVQAKQVIPQAQPPATPAKSPMDEFIEREGENAVPPAGVLKAQSAWEKTQASNAESQADLTAAQQSIAAHVAVTTDETIGEGLGFESIWDMAQAYITPQDEKVIRASGSDAGPMLYQICVKRILERGGPQAKLLASAIRQHRAVQPGVSTTQQTGKKPVKKTTEAPSREDVIQPAIHGATDMTGFFFPR